MRYLILTFLILIKMASSYSQVMYQIKTDEVKKWYYADGDEFNVDKINPDKWKYCPDWGSSVLKQNVYFTENENITISKGEAHFIAKNENYLGVINPWEVDTVWAKKNKIKIENNKTVFKYTAGALWSQKKYKYGYFECRFKSNNEKGIWPAFWLYAGHENDEIDWFELKGERGNQPHVDVHCPSGCENYRGGFLNLTRGWGGWINLTESLAKEYNVISGEWNENYLIWFLNGKPLCYFEHKYEFPMWLILNTSVASDDNGGFSPGPDAATKFPNDFAVDYVRVWSSADTVKEKTSTTFNTSEITMKNADNKSISQLKKPLKFIYAKKILNKELGSVTFLSLPNQQYSLTFNGNFTMAKIELQNSSKIKIKEFSLTNPTYFTIDVNDLESGTYTINVNTLGKVLTQDFTIKKFTR